MGHVGSPGRQKKLVIIKKGGLYVEKKDFKIKLFNLLRLGKLDNLWVTLIFHIPDFYIVQM